MIIPKSGLWKDGNQTEQPIGTWRDASNLVFDKSRNVISKELGFDELETSTIGSGANENIFSYVEVENDIVIFLYDSTANQDEIGILLSSGQYRKLLSVSTNGLNFDVNYPVKGKWVRNVIGQRVVVWTDSLNKLRYINVDKTFDDTDIDATEANKLLEVMCPEYNTQTFNESGGFYVDIINGGNLKSGSYIPLIRYKNSNGITTNWRTLCPAVYVSATNEGSDSVMGSPNVNSGKKINISLSSLDQDYKFLEVAAIASIDEIVTVKLIQEYETISGTINIIIDRYNEGTDLEFQDILNSKINYDLVGDIELIKDELLISNVSDQLQINYQKYANNILIDYRVADVTLDDLTGVEDNDHIKYFMPNEVYAFYVELELNDGSYTRAFHIPGRASVGTEKDVSTLDSNFSTELNLSFSVKRFHVESTADGVGVTNMGYWENGDEIYPNLDDYDSSGISGLDLRGLAVRHHRFPSLNHIRTQSYSADAAFGITKMPILSIDVSNVIIPTELDGLVKSYRILFAKRNTENQCVLGNAVIQPQGVIIDAERHVHKEEVYYAQGMPVRKQGGAASDNTMISQSAFRFHAFDLLVNKPQIAPLYLQQEYRLSTGSFTTIEKEGVALGSTLDDISAKVTGVYEKDAGTGRVRTFECYADAAAAIITTESTLANIVKVVKKHMYVPANTFVGNVNNTVGEEHLHLELEGDLTNVRCLNADPNSDPDFYVTTSYTIETYNSSLCQIPYNLYNKFYEQTHLVITASIVKNATKSLTFGSGSPNSQTDIKGGDSAPFNYFHVTHGGITADNFMEGDIAPDGSYVGFGFLNARYTLCYSTGLIDRRYQDLGDPNTYVYPAFARIDPSIFEIFDPTQGYKLKYSKDFSLLNEYSGSLPYNPYELLSLNSPYKIHRSATINRLLENIVFLFGHDTDDVFEMPKDKGFIIGLNNLNDRLIIRTRKSTYITSPKQKLQLSDNVATIGNNDLFDIEPEELITADRGYVGSTSKFNAIISEYGLIIIDDDSGKIFLLNPSGIEEVSKYGMITYFKESLNIINQYTTISFSTIAYAHYNDFRHETEFANLAYTIPLTKDNFTKVHTGDQLYDETQDLTFQISKVVIEDNTMKLIVFEGIITTGTPDSGTSNIKIVKRVDSPFANNGVIAAYDKKNQRFLITKRDADTIADKTKFLGFIDSIHKTSIESGYYFFKGNVLYVSDGAGGDSVASVINDSITVSYYPENKFWVSFHTYIPKFYIHWRNNLLSYDSSQGFFKHNIQTNTGYFYDDTSLIECSIKLIHNEFANIPKIYFRMWWNSILQDRDTEVKVEETFDKLTLLNSEQTSGEVTLTNYVDTLTKNNIRRVKGIWKFNKVKDSTTKKKLVDMYIEILLKETSNRLLYLYFVDLEYNKIKN